MACTQGIPEKLSALLVKIETTSCADALPSGVDHLLVSNLSITPTVESHERDVLSGDYVNPVNISGKKFMTMTYDVEVKGSNTAVDTAPPVGPVLRSAGFTETVNGSTSVVYTLNNTGPEAVTVYAYQNGVVYRLLGGKSNVSFTGNAGEIAQFSVTTTGLFGGRTDESIPTLTTDLAKPPPFLNASLTASGFSTTPIVSTINFDMGNEINVIPSITASGGYGGPQLTNRSITGSWNPLETVATTHDHWDDLISANQTKITFTVGSTATNRVTIILNQVTPTDTSKENREGLLGLNIPFMIGQHPTDSEVQLTFN